MSLLLCTRMYLAHRCDAESSFSKTIHPAFLLLVQVLPSPSVLRMHLSGRLPFSHLRARDAACHLCSAASAQVGFGQRFYSLIEHAVASNGDQPATIVAHSLGCLVSLYFLSRQEPPWLKRHVGALVAISGPWAGAVSGLKGD